jgi:hypothetical protein
MAGLLFVTAPAATHKDINEVLLSMRDWDDSNGGLDVVRMVTDKHDTQNYIEGTTIPPESLPENAWAGANVENIEAYCLHLKRSDSNEQTGANLFVVIDSEGLENTSRVLASFPDVFQENPGAFRGDTRKSVCLGTMHT